MGSDSSKLPIGDSGNEEIIPDDNDAATPNKSDLIPSPAIVVDASMEGGDTAESMKSDSVEANLDHPSPAIVVDDGVENGITAASESRKSDSIEKNVDLPSPATVHASMEGVDNESTKSTSIEENLDLPSPPIVVNDDVENVITAASDSSKSDIIGENVNLPSQANVQANLKNVDTESTKSDSIEELVVLPSPCMVDASLECVGTADTEPGKFNSIPTTDINQGNPATVGDSECITDPWSAVVNAAPLVQSNSIKLVNVGGDLAEVSPESMDRDSHSEAKRTKMKKLKDGEYAMYTLPT